MEKYSKRTQTEAKNLRIIDDALFRLVATYEGTCQEILRTLLDDPNLIVKKVIPQSTQVSLHRELILDAECILGDGTYCDVEMQKDNSNDDIRRVRFHASLLTANHTPKKAEFADVPNVIIIYISEYDALGNGQAVTHVSRCQLVGNIYSPINDGEKIIFANAASKQRNKQSKMLRLFLKKETFHDAEYPCLSEAIKHLKETKEGQNSVCKSIELYTEERIKAENVQKIIKMIKKGCTMEDILDFGFSESEYHLAEEQSAVLS